VTLLSNQIIESPEGHTRVFTAIFTQHSGPLKHDAARWVQSLTRDELQPFLEFNAKRVANRTAELGSLSRPVRKPPFPSRRQLSKKFFKKVHPLAREKPFALMSMQRFCDDH
jgi:hypothetical protein